MFLLKFDANRNNFIAQVKCNRAFYLRQSVHVIINSSRIDQSSFAPFSKIISALRKAISVNFYKHNIFPIPVGDNNNKNP